MVSAGKVKETMLGANHNLKGLDLLYGKPRNYILAIAEFSRAIFINSTEPSYYWHRAEAYFHVCDFESSILNFRYFVALLNDKHCEYRVYVKTKRMAFIMYTWGQILLDQKRFKEALDVFVQVIGLGMNHSFVATRLAIANIGLGNIKQAILELNKLFNSTQVGGFPDAQTYILRARLYFLENDIFSCNSDLASAIQLDPDHVSIYELRFKVIEYAADFKNKASEQLLLGEFNLALAFLSQAIELCPDDWKLYLTRGKIFSKLGRKREALDDLVGVYTNPARQHASELELELEISAIYLHLAISGSTPGSSMDDQEDRIEHFQLALNYNLSKKSLILFERSQFHFKRGNMDESLIDLFSIENWASNKKYSDAICLIYYSKGRTFVNAQEYKLAIQEFSKAISINPDCIDYYFERSKCLYYTAELEEMKGDLIKCLALDPKHSFSKAMLSLIDLHSYEPSFHAYKIPPLVSEQIYMAGVGRVENAPKRRPLDSRFASLVLDSTKSKNGPPEEQLQEPPRGISVPVPENQPLSKSRS